VTNRTKTQTKTNPKQQTQQTANPRNRSAKQQTTTTNKKTQQKRKVKEGMLMCIAGFAGQRARVPPDPIPNSEVKPRSVPNCSVVLGHVKLGKLAAYSNILKTKRDLPKLYN
jgi:hypothetical protein